MGCRTKPRTLCNRTLQKTARATRRDGGVLPEPLTVLQGSSPKVPPLDQLPAWLRAQAFSRETGRDGLTALPC